MESSRAEKWSQLRCAKTAVLEWPLGAGSIRESIPTDPHGQMSNFTTEEDMFTAWYKKQFWSLKLISLFMTTAQGPNFYTIHSFKLFYDLKICINKGFQLEVGAILGQFFSLRHFLWPSSAPPLCLFLD